MTEQKTEWLIEFFKAHPEIDPDYTIAEKTVKEILLMRYRWRWYKTISLEEKEEAMRIVEIVRRYKQSVSLMGHAVSEVTRVKISIGKMGKTRTDESKAKQSVTTKGKTLTKKHKDKISASRIGITPSEETKHLISKNHADVRGKNNPNYIDGRSFRPYCHLFNGAKKEEVRNRHGRVCILTDTLRSVMGPESGLDNFEGHEIFNRDRLCVHHIYGNKMAGCDGTELALIPLHRIYNSKKFNGFRLEDHPFYITLFILKSIERKHREEMLGFKEAAG